MSKALTVYRGIIDTAQREFFADNSTAAGIESYAQNALDIELSHSEIDAIEHALDQFKALLADQCSESQRFDAIERELADA